MSAAQTIFAVFFAIFWSAIFSVAGRWLMFQPIFKFPHVARRWVLSFALMNLAPAIFFALNLWLLRGGPDLSSRSATLAATLQESALAIFATFGAFGFYRLWMAIVEAAPTAFYQREAEQHPELRGIDPTIEKLNLDHPSKGWNFGTAALYIFIGFAAPLFR